MSGWIKIHRQLEESEIWNMPPEYVKLWLWILFKCNHEEVKRGGQTFHTGECLVTLQETIEQTKYKVGFRTQKITKDQAWRFYEYLREAFMVETTKTTMGMFVKVLQYAKYQQLKNNEPNNERDTSPTMAQQWPNTINKNEKNIRMKEEPMGVAADAAPTPGAMAERFFTDHDQQQAIIAFFVERGSEVERVRGELTKFIDYWTELNPTGRKKKWQMQQTFDVKKRLVTWFNKVQDFAPRSNAKPFKIPSI